MELRAEKISRSFPRGEKEFYAVRETDLTLMEGKLVVLEGRSGSGKTTLLNLLCGLQTPSSGRVTAIFRNEDSAAETKTDLYSLDDGALSRFRNAHFGIVPQGQSPVAALTVLENVMLPGTICTKGAGVFERASALLERMGIPELRDARPGDLSGGEMRRMAIARALIRNPEVVFADEPTSDLDDDNRDAVFRILRETADEGKSVLVVTHERAAAAYADAVYRMESGVLTVM